MREKRVLITGGAGYVGSVISRYLLENENRVTCLDNLRYRQQLSKIFLEDPNFAFVHGDVRDEGLVKSLVSKHDVIFPLAAIVGMPACNKYPQDAQTVNFGAVKMLNDIRSKSQIVIYPTTNSGYGSKTKDFFCTEETPLEPISLYGITKNNAEKELLTSGKDVITLRLATAFGYSLRMRIDLLVNDFVFKAMTEGTIELYEGNFMRNFIHVQDIARAFEHCVDNFISMKNNTYNLGLEDANLSKAQLATKIKEYIPHLIIKEGKGKDPDKRNYMVSNQKFMGTGFNPRYSIDYGIRELIEKYTFLLQDKSLDITLFKNV